MMGTTGRHVRGLGFTWYGALLAALAAGCASDGNHDEGAFIGTGYEALNVTHPTNIPVTPKLGPAWGPLDEKGEIPPTQGTPPASGANPLQQLDDLRGSWERP